MRTKTVACSALVGLLGCRGGNDSTERARRAESRIVAACTQAATMIPLTLHALDINPEIGFALATRDVSNVLLCGGDGGPIGDAIIRGDMAATRQGLVKLFSLWCPTCATPKEVR